MAGNGNSWVKGSRVREPAEFMKPVIDPAGWTAADVAGSEDWIYRLDEADTGELLSAVGAISGRGLDIKDIARDDFAVPKLAPALAEIRDELIFGRGFAKIAGLPLDGMSRAEAAAAFWGIGCHIGRQISQNPKGHLLGHVKDLGGDYKDANTRGYLTNQEMAFHNDQCDILGLCCLHPAKSGGDHYIVSSVTLYNEMLRRRPDLVKEYDFSFYRSRKGEIPVGDEKPWNRQRIFNFTDGYFAARGVGASVFKAQDLPGVPEFTDAQKEALDLYDTLTKELAVPIRFERGDIFFLLNHVTLHSRTDYEDWPEPERKRHLLRLWLDTDGARPLPPEVARQSAGVRVEGMEFTAPLDAE
jgi:hypothetical protein